MFANEAEKKISALVPEGSAIAIACSGGSDSMALALMAHEWAKKNGSSIAALTVDHGLRRESAGEAAQVSKWLGKQGIKHSILVWKGKKPKSNIQENARIARYRLLTDYCKKHGIHYLLVAHTLDDQAETFLMRLRRGSGVDGLSAMSAVSRMNGVTLVRPLLALRKEELMAFLKKEKQPYVTDPSNENEAFDRVKIRKLLPRLFEAGFTPERLALVARNMARASECLKRLTDDFLRRHCRLFDEGYAILRHLPDSEEIALRALARLLMTIGGQEMAPRLEQLERLYAALTKSGFKGMTVAGCKLQAASRHEFIILREIKAVAHPITIKPGERVIWDRFETDLELATCNLQLGALTQAGWLDISRKRSLKNPYPDKKILYTLPALRDAKGTIISVPHLGISGRGVQCRIRFICHEAVSASA